MPVTLLSAGVGATAIAGVAGKRLAEQANPSSSQFRAHASEAVFREGWTNSAITCGFITESVWDEYEIVQGETVACSSVLTHASRR